MATKKKSSSKSTAAKSAVGDVGLTTTKIAAMQSELNKYITEVTKKIKIGANTQHIQAAIKGNAAETEVKKYIADIDKACEDYLKNLQVYNNKLTEMANIYKTKDSFSYK